MTPWWSSSLQALQLTLFSDSASIIGPLESELSPEDREKGIVMCKGYCALMIREGEVILKTYVKQEKLCKDICNECDRLYAKSYVEYCYRGLLWSGGC